jgi:hypothetical protein
LNAVPIERRAVSVSQFADLLGVDPQRLIGVERKGSTMILLLEPEDDTTVRDVPATQGQHDPQTPA